MRIIRAPDYKTMLWKNGGGTTTEIAISPEGATLDDFDWRISMAHVGADGPFSGFPGIDRTLSVLNGAGIRLVFADGEAATIDVGSRPFGFAADRSVTGKLVAGPIDDLNVMSRRGRWSHAVQRLSDLGPHIIDSDDGLLVLVARQGDWQVRGNTASLPLQAGDTLIAPAPDRLEITNSKAGDLFAVRLWPTG